MAKTILKLFDLLFPRHNHLMKKNLLILKNLHCVFRYFFTSFVTTFDSEMKMH